MEREKKLVAIITAAMIALTIFTPAFLVRPASADETSWYMNVKGVLDSDYYSLYPFLTDASLNLGFSKFGEIIDSTANVGLEYRDRDAFAPAAGASVPSQITKNKWMSGWLINITYMSTGGARNIWAMAQHADLIDYGKDWIRVHSNYSYAGALTEATEDPTDPGKFISDGTGPHNGGRKTNGTATTDPILVLYNGPRMFVARTVTHIFDWDPAWSADEPLVDVVFTFIFNKDKKEVIVIKDIKEATTKFVFGEMKVPIADDVGRVSTANQTVNGAIIQFSNRGEWDIGPSPTFDSYVHFYVANNTESQPTYYDYNGNLSDSYHLNPTLPYANWLGISDHGSEPTTPGQYDVAQIVASDAAYAGWAAFWPCLSNWHVDAGYKNVWWHSLSTDESITDVDNEPFMSPYLIGEWDFVLTKTAVNKTDGTYWRLFDRQFRGVTVYGLSDNWIGDDANSGGEDVIDREVEYQLDEIFLPWDLLSAVEKKTNRWVDFHTVTATEYAEAVELETPLTFNLSHTPVVYRSNWEEYCNDHEIVEWDGEMKHPVRSVWIDDVPYELFYDQATGVGRIEIDPDEVPTTGTIIKVLYSTAGEGIPGRYEWVVVGNHSRALDSVGAAMVSAAFKNKKVEIGNGALDMKDMWGPNTPYLMANLTVSTWRAGGPAWTKIYDSIGRLGYVDDWCTRYPVSTSNIITVAGPPANLMSEYWNEFSQAIMIYGIMSGNLIDVIFAPTCWNTTRGSNYKGQYYYSDGQFVPGKAGYGIGVITTYKDINGTVGFMIYGWSGDDTYYTCKWFHETGIYYLQTENPGVTSLIVQLNYNNKGAVTLNPKPPNYAHDAHYPTVTILERLGTISEKNPHDP